MSHTTLPQESLTITALAYGGRGIARRASGKTVFVDGAVVGDVVHPLTVRESAGFDRCDAFELLQASDDRLPAACPYATLCGGCPWQTHAYQQQLFWKRRFAVDALVRITGLPTEQAEAVTAECLPAPQQWHYRNKVELHAFTQNGKLGLGLRKRESHEHVRIDACRLMPRALSTMPKELAGSLNYALKEGFDELSRVAVRSSSTTGSTEIALYMLPSKVNRALLATVLARSKEGLVRVLVDGNLAARKVKQVEVLAGKGFWVEEMGGFTYRISAPSFFQVNSAAARAMVAHVVRLLNELGLPATAPVADLYCGAGTFTLPLAARFTRVIAIESAGSSLRDLRRNLESNGLAAEVIGGDVARELAGLDPVELAVVDPPRSGLQARALEALKAYAPRHLIYVSCNPTTQARDLKALIKAGYRLQSMQPFDQFPQSYHVELIALLSLP